MGSIDEKIDAVRNEIRHLLKPLSPSHQLCIIVEEFVRIKNELRDAEGEDDEQDGNSVPENQALLEKELDSMLEKLSPDNRKLLVQRYKQSQLCIVEKESSRIESELDKQKQKDSSDQQKGNLATENPETDETNILSALEQLSLDSHKPIVEEQVNHMCIMHKETSQVESQLLEQKNSSDEQNGNLVTETPNVGESKIRYMLEQLSVNEQKSITIMEEKASQLKSELDKLEQKNGSEKQDGNLAMETPNVGEPKIRYMLKPLSVDEQKSIAVLEEIASQFESELDKLEQKNSSEEHDGNLALENPTTDESRIHSKLEQISLDKKKLLAVMSELQKFGQANGSDESNGNLASLNPVEADIVSRLQQVSQKLFANLEKEQSLISKWNKTIVLEQDDTSNKQNENLSPENPNVGEPSILSALKQLSRDNDKLIATMEKESARVQSELKQNVASNQQNENLSPENSNVGEPSILSALKQLSRDNDKLIATMEKESARVRSELKQNVASNKQNENLSPENPNVDEPKIPSALAQLSRDNDKLIATMEKESARVQSELKQNVASNKQNGDLAPESPITGEADMYSKFFVPRFTQEQIAQYYGFLRIRHEEEKGNVHTQEESSEDKYHFLQDEITKSGNAKPKRNRMPWLANVRTATANVMPKFIVEPSVHDVNEQANLAKQEKTESSAPIEYESWENYVFGKSKAEIQLKRKNCVEKRIKLIREYFLGEQKLSVAEVCEWFQKQGAELRKEEKLFVKKTKKRASKSEKEAKVTEQPLDENDEYDSDYNDFSELRKTFESIVEARDRANHNDHTYAARY